MDTTIECRPCLPTDDREAIALCLYQTDPYIYPHLGGGDKARAIALLARCVDLPKNPHYYENLTVALIEGRIVGVICTITDGYEYSFLEGLSIPEEDLPCVRHVNEGYYLPLIEENLEIPGDTIVNVCTLDESRGKGVASALLGYYLEHRVRAYPIYLDVIADNDAAIRLYERYGFRLLKERNGYRPSGEPLLCRFYRKEK